MIDEQSRKSLFYCWSRVAEGLVVGASSGRGWWASRCGGESETFLRNGWHTNGQRVFSLSPHSACIRRVLICLGTELPSEARLFRCCRCPYELPLWLSLWLPLRLPYDSLCLPPWSLRDWTLPLHRCPYALPPWLLLLLRCVALCSL